MQDDLKQVLTEQLRDIHLPEAVGWWPLAPGWWILMFISLAILITLITRTIRNNKLNAYRVSATLETHEAFALWQKGNDTAVYLKTINAILKRISLHHDSTSSVANQSGINWVESLNQASKQPLSEETMQALGVACYQTKPETDVEHVQQQIVSWIELHDGVEHA